MTVPLDTIVCADALEFMKGLPDNTVDLTITSPVYANVKDGCKVTSEYKGVKVDKYLDWIAPFCEQIKRILKDTGSFILNIDGFIHDGQLDLYPERLLIRLVDELGFYYICDGYMVKPLSLPSGISCTYTRPRRSVEKVYWLAKTKHPAAHSKSILMKYSASFEKKVRETSSRHSCVKRYVPSGHSMVDSRLMKNHGGSTPGNYIFTSVGDSNAEYMNEWKRQKLDIHPARFSEDFVRYYILFLTNPGDLVFDPFCGSGTSASVAKECGRHWLGCDISSMFVRAAEIRVAMTSLHVPDADCKLEEFEKGDKHGKRKLS